MTVNEIKKEFKKIDEKLSKIEGLLNNASTGVDFYNAYVAYKNSEDGSPEQGLAILDIFSSAFDFGSNVLPPLLGGSYMDAGSWFLEIIESDIALPQYWEYYNNKAAMLYSKGIITKQEAEEYANKCIANLKAAREATKLANEINQIDEVFYDIGLFNPVTGEIDLTVYNNWEDVLKKYAEDNFISENGLNKFEKNCKDGAKIIVDWAKTQYENWCDGIEIIKNRFVNIKKVKNSVSTASSIRYDPLILDLDGDGFNVKKKELGANFDLDKNGFAEKINWTSRDGFLCLDLNGSGEIDDGGELGSTSINLGNKLLTIYYPN